MNTCFAPLCVSCYHAIHSEVAPSGGPLTFSKLCHQVLLVHEGDFRDVDPPPSSIVIPRTRAKWKDKGTSKSGSRVACPVQCKIPSLRTITVLSMCKYPLHGGDESGQRLLAGLNVRPLP